MAGRFLFRQLAFRMSRSTSLPSVRPSAPVTRRALESGVRTLNIFSHSSLAHPGTVVPNNPGIHGFPARYLSTLPCTRAASKRSSPPNGMPSVIAGRMKPALVDSARVKRTFSSSPSAKDTFISWEDKLPASEAEWQAKWEADRAACKAECAALEAKWKADDAAFNRYVMTILGSWCYIGLVFNSMLGSESSHGGTSSCEGQNAPHCHIAASATPAVQNPDVQ